MRKSVVLLALALPACNLAPDHVRPAAPISASYPIEPARAAAGNPLATELGWAEFFGDPRLRALIGTALERNRDLAQSLARIDQARARFRIQEAQRLPTIETSASAARSRQPTGLAIPGAPASAEASQFALNVGVSAFELDLWGRVRNLAEAERHRYLATVEGARAFRLSLIAQVAAVYFDILSGEERIAIAERALAGRREGVRIAQRRLDAGITSNVDFNQTVLLQTQAEAELAELRRTTQQSRNLLDLLVGGPVSDPLPPGLPLAQASQVRPIEPGLPSALLADRPDVLQAELNLRAANANIGAARAAMFPTISLTGAFGFASGALGTLLDGDSQAWNAGGALNLPIFDWGRREADVRLSRAQADELIAAYQRAVQGAFREVADALAGRRYLAEQIEAQSRAVAAQRQLARTARLRYDNGISIYLEVLDAERTLFTTEQQLLQLRAIDLQNSVSLYTALGGGTERTAAAR